MIIYSITAPSGKTYVGKTVQPLKKRIAMHKCYALKKNSQYAIHRAIRKYGFDNMVFEVLEETDNYRFLNELEQYFIKSFNCMSNGYNMTHGGEGVRMSQELRDKVSKRMTGPGNHQYGKPSHLRGKKMSPETIEKNRQARIGKKLSDETKRKIGIASTGRIFSEETREKIASAQRGLVHSEERRKLASLAMKKVWEEKLRLGIPFGRWNYVKKGDN